MEKKHFFTINIEKLMHLTTFVKCSVHALSSLVSVSVTRWLEYVSNYGLLQSRNFAQID